MKTDVDGLCVADTVSACRELIESQESGKAGTRIDTRAALLLAGCGVGQVERSARSFGEQGVGSDVAALVDRHPGDTSLDAAVIQRRLSDFGGKRAWIAPQNRVHDLWRGLSMQGDSRLRSSGQCATGNTDPGALENVERMITGGIDQQVVEIEVARLGKDVDVTGLCISDPDSRVDQRARITRIGFGLGSVIPAEMDGAVFPSFNEDVFHRSVKQDWCRADDIMQSHVGQSIRGEAVAGGAVAVDAVLATDILDRDAAQFDVAGDVDWTSRPMVSNAEGVAARNISD